MNVGPVTREQLNRLARTWEQGEHVIVSGPTKSGKTHLVRYLDEIRLQRGGYVIVFVAKLLPDPTILEHYKGWTRWTKMKKNPNRNERRILLWPDLSKAKGLRAKRDLQKEVFQEALDRIGETGKWTVHFDEGLYMCDPKFMNMSEELAMLHAVGRTSDLTLITLTQRPAHLPLIIYGSASHAFVGRTRESADLKRLSELGGKQSAKELEGTISAQGRHDFLWLPVAPDWEPESVNLKR